jgi:hypothetical protein
MPRDLARRRSVSPIVVAEAPSPDIAIPPSFTAFRLAQSYLPFEHLIRENMLSLAAGVVPNWDARLAPRSLCHI